MIYTEEDLDHVREKIGEDAFQRFKKKLDKKEEELSWTEDHSQIAKRFYNFFGENGTHMAEMQFCARNKNYRGLFIVVQQANAVVFHDVIKKENNYRHSEQRKIINEMQDNPSEVKDMAKEKVLEVKY